MNVGPCHHGMLHPWVVVGGDSLQIGRLPTRGGPLAWMLGKGLTTQHNKLACNKTYSGPRTWMGSGG